MFIFEVTPFLLTFSLRLNPVTEKRTIPRMVYYREALTDAQRQFYYEGLRQVLLRHRYMTLVGWLVVLLAFLSLPLGWGHGLPHGLLDILLGVGGILAGILVVQQAVMAVESYIDVPFPDDGKDRPAVNEIRSLMNEIDEGGWWETTAGIRKLDEIAAKYGLQST